jgi:Putative zinc-finger
MNKCAELEIQEMLPDLLHRRLDSGARARVEIHVAGCAECAEDLKVLRTVKSAAVFIPSIDVDRVVQQIPPYRPIAPVAQAPARSRVVSWLVAASLAVVTLGGGSLLMVQQKPSFTQSGTGSALPSGTHSLALGTGVDGLSDNNLRQLMTDMNSFDALPAAEVEPVLSVDNTDSLVQGTR